MNFALNSPTQAQNASTSGIECINIQVIERLVLHAQVAMNAAEAAPDDRFLGLALLNPAPVLVPHRMIRPYWLVYSICRFSGLIDSISFLRRGWRALLKKVPVVPLCSTTSVLHTRCAPKSLTFAT